MLSMFDLIASSIIAAGILILLVQMNIAMGDTSFQTTLDVTTQTNARTIADMLNDDFYRIGYHDQVTNPNPIIELADSNRIRFRSDIDNNGTIDTIQYSTSSAYSVHGSSVLFKSLYRTVNSPAPTGANLGLTALKFSYYDTLGVLINLPTPTDSASRRRIQSIKIQMLVKNSLSVDTTTRVTFDTTFAATYFEKWISPMNLRVLK